MSNATVTLINVSKPYENIFIKELNINVSYGGDFIVTNNFTFDQISSANSLADAIQNDKILIKINDNLQSKADSILYVTTPAPPGSGEVNTASNVGGGAGVFKQKTGVDLEFRSLSSADFDITEGTDEIEIQAQPQLITNYASITPIAGMKVLLENSGTLRSTDVANFLASTPMVDDAIARDAAYPSPTNNFQVFNKRQGLIETYNSGYDLWISVAMNICVEDTTVQTVAVQKVVFITTTAATIGGVEFPVLNYISSTGERNVTQGVVTRRGAATGNPNETYVAVHHFGIYYVDYSAAITIGYNVYPNTAGAGDVIGAAFAQSGTIGQAIENSGSNPSFPSSVLVSLQNRR
jgi:hypothetical protein